MRLSFYPVTRQNAFAHVTLLPPPRVPWQITGNHWIALPCIHPADGSVHALGVLHRGSRSAIELAASADFLSGTGVPLLKPTIRVGESSRDFAGAQMAWERALGWIPTFSCTIGSIVVRGTIFAPYGRDADAAGAVYALSVENRSGEATDVGIGLDGRFGHRQLRVRSARRFADENVVTRGLDDVILLQGSAPPGEVAVGIGADGPAEISVGDRRAEDFTLRRGVRVQPGAREHVAFYIGAMGGYGWSRSGGRDWDGGFAGGTIGANWQMSNIVLGVEAGLKPPCENFPTRSRAAFAGPASGGVTGCTLLGLPGAEQASDQHELP